MNLLLNFNSTEYYQPGDTLPGKTNAGLMGAAEEKLVPQIEPVSYTHLDHVRHDRDQ